MLINHTLVIKNNATFVKKNKIDQKNFSQVKYYSYHKKATISRSIMINSQKTNVTFDNFYINDWT